MEFQLLLVAFPVISFTIGLIWGVCNQQKKKMFLLGILLFIGTILSSFVIFSFDLFFISYSFVYSIIGCVGAMFASTIRKLI